MVAEIYFIWVGQGDCTLIKTAGGKTILIDCGTSDNMSIYDDNIAPTITQIMKDVGNKNYIDYLILTHSDKDHCNCIQRLTAKTSLNLAFNNVYYGGDPSQYAAKYLNIKIGKNSDKFKNIIHLTSPYFNNTDFVFTDNTGGTEESLKIISANVPFIKGQHMVGIETSVNKKKPRSTVGKGDNDIDNNGNSIVAIFKSYGEQFAFLGDANENQQNRIIENVPQAKTNLTTHVTKLSHHGSPYSYNEAFMNTVVKPKGVGISSGITFGGPAKTVLDKMTDLITGQPNHQYLQYNDTINPTKADKYYEQTSTTRYIYNTNSNFINSGVWVPTHTKSNKVNKDKHAGEEYTALLGANVILKIDASGVTQASGSEKRILTTKRTKNVTDKSNARKRRR